MKDSNSIKEMEKALKCLYLEVDSSIADDLVKRFEAVIQSQQQEIADVELEKRADNYADDCGYPKSDKEHFETTYWCQHNIAQHSFISGFKAALNQKGNDSGWVSVEDKNRLPEEGNCYLCYLKMKEGNGHAYDTLCLVNGDFGVFDNKKYDVTHWQPLPSPPIQSKL